LSSIAGFWFNLDRFLYEQALADPAHDAVAPEWTAALDYYRKKFIKASPPSGEVVQLHDRLGDLEVAASLEGSGLDPELIATLEAAAPVYRERWWPAHDRENHAWIRAVSPMLSKYNADLKRDLAKAYATTWPSMPIRVDVCEYANWAGAYTTIDPSHITISSVAESNQGDSGLEMLFHEGSHTIFQKVLDAMGSTCMQALTPFLMAFEVTQLRREGVMPAGYSAPAKTAPRSSSKFPFRFAARRSQTQVSSFQGVTDVLLRINRAYQESGQDTSKKERRAHFPGWT